MALLLWLPVWGRKQNYSLGWWVPGGPCEHRRGFWNPDWRSREGVLEHVTFQLRSERSTLPGKGLVCIGMQ